jgi:methionine biosynthesis protein MetW
MKEYNSNMRFDFKIIASWIKSGSNVLALGCGEGDMLYFLKKNNNIKETGIEIKESRVAKCIEKGLTVLQGDINEEVMDYPDNCFDYVILSQTMQQVYEPFELTMSMLRIGKKCVVSFPNFCQWKIRTQILFSGHVPKTRELPYEWYNTPNIRLLSIKDFRSFSKKAGFNIIKQEAFNPTTQLIRLID